MGPREPGKTSKRLFVNSAIKLNTLLAILLASLILLLVYLNNIFHPFFLEGKNNTLLFGHGVTYSESGVEKYREFHTDSEPDGYLPRF